MSILQETYKLCPIADLDQDNPKLVPLPRKVAEELVVLAVLAPLMTVDLSAKFDGRLYATDASDVKGAVVSRHVFPEVQRALWRTGRKKGGYVRMLTRFEALIQKLDPAREAEAAQEPRVESVDRPMAYRFYFVEICGGAGKISAAMTRLGWSCGPVLDLEASPHYDLSSLRLLQWLYGLLEEGRLDSFIVEPPCTTFSPAQHPASRSYAEPRGFEPTDPKTHRGTTLALRALSLVKLGALLKVPSLLEQPRKSKIRKLSKWIYLLQVSLAYEEWLASCMYGSPHKKEFVFLAAAIDIRPIHMKCSGDYSHIPIQGSYTKPSATYTDELASALAACFDKALAQKFRTEQVFKVKSQGLETPLCNDMLVSGDWQVERSWRWKKPGHINVREVVVASRLLHDLASKSPKTRPVIVMDSNVGLSSLVKGRSPSYGLQRVLRRVGAASVAGSLYPAYHFGPTRMIPADHPTRDHDIPPPCKSFLRSTDTLEYCLSLAKVQGLARHSANWIRLFLMLLGRQLPWLSTEDSWRYAHYTYKHYPFVRAVKPLASMDFDATKGFAGEGPLPAFGPGLWIFLDFKACSLMGFGLWILWISVACCVRVLGCGFSFLARLTLFDPAGLTGLWTSLRRLPYVTLRRSLSACLSVCVRPLQGPRAVETLWQLAVGLSALVTALCGLSVACRPCFWILCLVGLSWTQQDTRISFLGGFWGVRFCLVCSLVIYPAGGVSHGKLCPRDAADRLRAQQRLPADLPAGRPVLGQTQKQRDKLLAAFGGWLREEGFELDMLLGVGSPDIETINILLERYGQALFRAGRPYGHYSETINGVVGKRPTLRRQLQQAWDLAFSWLRQEPPVHHVALPWQALLSLLSTSLSWGWLRVAGVLALSWGGIARIGEVFASLRRNLILPADVGFTTSFVLLEIMEPKTRFRAARHQVAKVDQCQLVELVSIAFRDLKPEQKLWPFSPQTMRARFKKLLEATGLADIPADLQRGLDRGSLRAGGATWLLMESEDSELTRRRGRWVTNKVIEVYVQETSAIQFLPRLPIQIRERILAGATLFPWCLSLATQLASADVPEKIWYIVFRKEAAELDVSTG